VTKGHWSDCAVYNAPAKPKGKCDCGGLDLAAYDAYRLVTSDIPTPRSLRDFAGQAKAPRLVEPHKLPSGALPANAATADLPDPHDRVAIVGSANGMDFDNA
jgi:hypothetical protein